jgi:hypothetical protein
MSVVAPIASKILRRGERSDVPLTTNAPQQTASLFDHLVGERKQLRRHIETERFCGLEIDHEFEFDRLHHRQIGLAEDAVIMLEGHKANRIAQTTSAGFGKKSKSKTESK